MPLVSVIIPTHNRSSLLRLAIDSVLAQTHAQLELIVVDDGSTDDTADVVAGYGDRVIYIRQQNAGVSAARNRGFAAARGQYISFLDDDDLFLPQKIARQAALLDAEPQYGLVHCRYYHMDETGALLNRIGLLPEGAVLKELACRNFLWMSAPLIRRSCLEAAGPFDPALSPAADYDLWLRIALTGSAFGCVQEPLGAYRIQRGSMVTNIAKTEREVIAILDRLFARPDLPPEVAAARGQAYATWLFWFSRRYYGLGDWDSARRSLLEALALDPAHIKDRAAFVQGFCSEALDERVGDPFRYISDVFDHLPPELDFAAAYRPEMDRAVAVGLALREYGTGDSAAARQKLADAIAAHPEIVNNPSEFADRVFDNALCLPVDPLIYVHTVFEHLPPQAQPLGRLQRRVLSDVNIARAFEDYFSHRQGQAARRILTALRHRPQWIKNRGVVSVLARSLPGLFAREESTGL